MVMMLYHWAVLCFRVFNTKKSPLLYDELSYCLFVCFFLLFSNKPVEGNLRLASEVKTSCEETLTLDQLMLVLSSGA